MNFREWLLYEETHEFSCVLVPLDKIAARLMKWSKKHINNDDLYEPEGGRDEHPHVTALYGLHTKNVDDVRPILKRFKPFEVKLGKISKFESGQYDVLNIEVSSPILRDINSALKKLPYTSKYPKYIPHCTIAYVKSGSCDALLNNEDFEGVSVIVKTVTFSSAAGNKTNIHLIDSA